MKDRRNHGESSPPVVYTLGTSTRSLEDFLDILRTREITQVCDVRSFPTSKRFPHFSSEPFTAALQEEGISYLWLGKTLGGYRKGGYQAHTETEEFSDGIQELEDLSARASTAIVCAERLPWKCHRLFIANALEERGWEVIHVLDASRNWTPTPRAQSLPLE